MVQRKHVMGFACALLAARSASAADINADPMTYKALLPTLKAGDTLHLAAGNYPRLAITNLNGTPNAWITIKGAAGDPPPSIIDADLGPCCNTIEITGSSWVALENLTVDGHDVDGAFGVSAKGGTGNLVHDIRIEGCNFINHHGSQQHDAISTKTPTWGWIIRRNKIIGAGTGLYLGNSTGDDPFFDGIIEDNLVVNPIGYCMEIKWQLPRPMVQGMPMQPTSNIVRNNVFIKNDDPSPDGDRPNILIDALPQSGTGTTDRNEVYGNFFFHNARQPLIQASGRISIHDNVFVDAPGQQAILLQTHDSTPVMQAYVYDNSIYAAGTGIAFSSAATQDDAVFGNLIFSSNPISGAIKNQKDNLTDTVANAPSYVNAPSLVLGQMDFYPKPGQCKGAAIDTSALAKDVDYAVDFNCTARGFDRRGAYAGEGKNPGWQLDNGIKSSGGCGGGDGGSSGPGPGGNSGGCSCNATNGDSSAPVAVLFGLAILARRRVISKRRAAG